MKKYKSPALKHIHEGAAHFFEEGIINVAEMKEFDKGCLVSGTGTSLPATSERAPMVASAVGSAPYGRILK
jgi:putative transcriptional regulator